jgi:hypothetical protein
MSVTLAVVGRLTKQAAAGTAAFAGVLLATVLFAGGTLGASSPPARKGRIGTKLTWAPPKLTKPITITIPTTAPVQLSLDPGQDYILRLGHLSGPGGLTVTGGHNIIVIGGWITPVVDTVEKDGLALRFEDQTGIVHLEGILIDDAGDAITIRAPLGIFQIENVRVENLHAYRDDFNYAHPDLIQTWSGPTEIRIDHFTGQSDYQGFTWMQTGGPGVPYPGRVFQKNVNISALMPQPDTVLTWPDGTKMDKPNLGPGTWHVSSSTSFSCQACWLLTGWYSQGYRRKLQESIGGWLTRSDPCCSYDQPPFRVTGGRGANLGRHQGDSMSWPTVPQLAREVWFWGRPPGRDFVRPGIAGVDYVSPGYRSRLRPR